MASERNPLRGERRIRIFRRLIGAPALALIPLAVTLAVGAFFLRGTVAPGTARSATVGRALSAVILQQQHSSSGGSGHTSSGGSARPGSRSGTTRIVYVRQTNASQSSSTSHS
ncbi:MAG TPA: hypothetical protein VE055_03775, partial [Gaiellaceae bacterium]|nr:hypothetical protein [Gaiellaceae bacterium]